MPPRPGFARASGWPQRNHRCVQHRSEHAMTPTTSATPARRRAALLQMRTLCSGPGTGQQGEILEERKHREDDASQRIMTSSRSRLTIVTSTINLIFSFVLEFENACSKRLPIRSIRTRIGPAPSQGGSTTTRSTIPLRRRTEIRNKSEGAECPAPVTSGTSE